MSLLDKLGFGAKKDAGVRAPNEAERAAADALIAQGQAAEDAGDLAAAGARFREAIAAAPGYPRAHINLGNALHKEGRLAEAAAAHGAAIERDAAYAPAYFNHGVVLLAMGKVPEARRRFEKALELTPDMASAAIYLAQVHEMEGDLAGACRELERALAFEPGLVQARADLGGLRIRGGRLAEGEAAYREALRMDPRCAAALIGLAHLEMARGETAAATARYRAAIDAEPQVTGTWNAYLMSLNNRADLEPEAIAREHRAFGELVRVEQPSPEFAARGAGEPIRVGYVSGDFKASPVAWFIAPVLDHHDEEAFETFCYSNVDRDDEVTAKLRPMADHWRAIRGLDDAAAAELIRRDRIDVLVDLSGHTLGNRLGVFAQRAAPVQASWLGYLNTTGLAAMDYRITDRHTDPPGMTEALHTEALVRMPESQWCWVPFHDVEARRVPDPDPARPVTFGSFNHIGKITDASLDLWSEILRRVPGSRLRIHAVRHEMFAASLRARLAARGVEGTRVETAGFLPIRDYFAAFDAIDIALDTLPYNGGTTTFVTYWMGVPMVALEGTRGIARGGYSIATSAGLGELVARTPAEYVERNVRLATDGAARVALARSLRSRLQASTLCDPARFTRDLEALYRDMLVRRSS